MDTYYYNCSVIKIDSYHRVIREDCVLFYDYGKYLRIFLYHLSYIWTCVQNCPDHYKNIQTATVMPDFEICVILKIFNKSTNSRYSFRKDLPFTPVQSSPSDKGSAILFHRANLSIMKVIMSHF